MSAFTPDLTRFEIGLHRDGHVGMWCLDCDGPRAGSDEGAEIASDIDAESLQSLVVNACAHQQHFHPSRVAEGSDL